MKKCWRREERWAGSLSAFLESTGNGKFMKIQIRWLRKFGRRSIQCFDHWNGNVLPPLQFKSYSYGYLCISANFSPHHNCFIRLEMTAESSVVNKMRVILLQFYYNYEPNAIFHFPLLYYGLAENRFGGHVFASFLLKVTCNELSAILSTLLYLFLFAQFLLLQINN